MGSPDMLPGETCLSWFQDNAVWPLTDRQHLESEHGIVHAADPDHNGVYTKFMFPTTATCITFPRDLLLPSPPC